MPTRPRDTHSSAELTRPATSRASWRTRVPWIPIAISLVVLIASAFAVPPVRDAATLQKVSEAYLARPVGYVALAPLSNMLDAIMLLSARQHVALVLGLMAVWAVWAVWAAWRLARAHRTRRRWRGHLTSLSTLLVSIVAAYAAAVYLPRPMAYLASDDANILRVDFHSHTARSQHARQMFSVERNGAWHRAGGYDVAYVTDHASVAKAERDIANYPLARTEGVVLLQGLEVTWMGEHVGLLGPERTYRGPLTPSDPRGLATASLIRDREALVIWNHPRQLHTLLPFASGPPTAGVHAIEISNGAPYHSDGLRLERQEIVALAGRYDVALTTGSDNHGWGYVAPNWTVMRLTNWRGLDDDELAVAIEHVIRNGGFGATRTVERASADPGTSAVALGFTVIGVPWRILTTLSADERLMWLIWTWAITGVVLPRRRGCRMRT